MAANPFSEDDTESVKNWDACWNALERLPSDNLSTVAIRSQAAKIVNLYRTATEGRGIEHIEERARAAYRLTAGRLAVGSDERLNRFMVALDGALSVLRRVPREATPANPR
jgi:hypothetical protein